MAESYERHDFKLCEISIGFAISDKIKAKLDFEYQGILKFHKNSETPKEKAERRAADK